MLDLEPDLMRTHREGYETCPVLACMIGFVFEAAIDPKMFPGKIAIPGHKSLPASHEYLKRAADVLSVMIRSESSNWEYSAWKDNLLWGSNYEPTFQVPHGNQEYVETWDGMFDTDQDTVASTKAKKTDDADQDIVEP